LIPITNRLHVSLQEQEHPLVHGETSVHTLLTCAMEGSQSRHGQIKTRPILSQLDHYLEILLEHLFGVGDVGIVGIEEEGVQLD
jgi:hypothetical protein